MIDSPILAGLLGSTVAGMATALGAVPILFRRHYSPYTQALMLAGAGGVMLGATFLSLMAPALLLVEQRSGSPLWAAVVVGSGVLFGAFFLWFVHDRLPHHHEPPDMTAEQMELRSRMRLFIFAIALHNFPEGLSVGVAYGAGAEIGHTVMIGIGLQNMPEGLAVAAAMTAVGATRLRAFLVAGATGLVEPVGGLVGVLAVTASQAMLPLGLAAAAGAMLFVVLGEIVPETHRPGLEKPATFSLLLGFVVMMLLDAGFG